MVHEPPVTRPDFQTIYEEHFDHVWRTLRRLGVADRDLEDAAHDLFVVVHRRLDDFDPRRPVRPWLTGMAYRIASDERRRARHRREVLDHKPEHPDTRPGPEEQAEARQQRQIVLHALGALPPEQRIVFVMHELDGSTVPEIAGALEAPINTCYSRLRLARRRFAEAVKRIRPHGGEP